MNAVITGAARGIGKALAEIFALHGYNLFLCSKTDSSLQATMEELRTRFPSVTVDGKALDISQKQNAVLFGQWVLNQADAVDVLINNAGAYSEGKTSDEPEGALEEMLATNLFSAYHTTRTLLPKMKAQKRGHVFTLCSVASLAACPGAAAYGISKYALLGFTRNLRYELKEYGIKVTAVIPGAVYTDSWRNSAVPPERIMEAADLARMVFAATQLSPQAVAEDIVLRPLLGDL